MARFAPMPLAKIAADKSWYGISMPNILAVFSAPLRYLGDSFAGMQSG